MSFKYTPTTLRKLEDLFDAAGYAVRYERGSFASGHCLLEERKVAVINRFLPVEGRINALLEILPAIALAAEAVPHELKTFYTQAVTVGTPAASEEVGQADLPLEG